MSIVLFLAILPALAGLVAAFCRRLRANPRATWNDYAWAAVASAAMPAVLMVLLAVAHATLNYEGLCYAFTDGEWTCDFLRFLTVNAGWALLLSVPFILLLVPLMAVTFALAWIKDRYWAPVRENKH